MRLEVKYRSDAAGRRLALDHSASGSGSHLLPLGTQYETLADLCDELQTQLQTRDADMRCSESDGVVTISDANGDDFEVDWTHPRLRDWLGFDDNLSGASTYTGSRSPGTLMGALPWSSGDPLGWCWYTRQYIGDHQSGGSVKLSKLSKWSVDMLLTPDDLPAFRDVISYAMRGYGLRWWRDVDVATAWSYSNWWGYLDCRLDPEWRSYTDDWHDPVTQLQLRASLQLMVEA